MQIHEVTEPMFREYGKVLDNVDVSELVAAMAKTPCPEDGTVYVGSDAVLEALPVKDEIQRVLYGELPIEIGYCNGHNTMLNGLEYHRCSEINIACGHDAVLLVGRQTDIEPDFTYDTSKVVAFRIPEGVAVEVYATTLHYAPCHVDPEGFRVVVILTKGTNEPLDTEHMVDTDPAHGEPNEDRLLRARNKWLLAHPDGGQHPDAFLGLRGENISL